jgi:hypothetical protein
LAVIDREKRGDKEKEERERERERGGKRRRYEGEKERGREGDMRERDKSCSFKNVNAGKQNKEKNLRSDQKEGRRETTKLTGKT